MITPITIKMPIIPKSISGSVVFQDWALMAMVTTASREANKVCISYPPYDTRVRIRPPAITEAIWPETLTLMEYINRKFCGSSFRPIWLTTRPLMGNAEIPAAPIMGLIFFSLGRNRWRRD